MPMTGIIQCAVRGCGKPISGPRNLCPKHALPGEIAKVGDSTMVITVWLVEHEDEVGVIVLNDYALGDLFGGKEGFLIELAMQGFTNIRLAETPRDLEMAEQQSAGRVQGDWSGPWLREYPWETTSGIGLENHIR